MAAVLIVWAAGIPAILLLSASITSRRRERASRADAGPSPFGSLPLLSTEALLSARPVSSGPRRAPAGGCR